MKATFEHQTWVPTELINDNTVTLNGLKVTRLENLPTLHFNIVIALWVCTYTNITRYYTFSYASTSWSVTALYIQLTSCHMMRNFRIDNSSKKLAGRRFETIFSKNKAGI